MDKALTYLPLFSSVKVLGLLANVSGATYKTMRAVMREDPGMEYQAVLRTKASSSGAALGYGPESRRYLGGSLASYRLSAYVFGSLGRFRKRLKRLVEETGADVVHAFGAPDDMGVIAKSGTEVPVIHEVFDMTSLYDLDTYGMPREDSLLNILGLHRLTRPLVIRRELEWEEYVHRNCEALVYTSEYMLEAAREKYGDFRSVVVPNAVLKEDIPKQRLPKLSSKDNGAHAVYVGQIELKPSHRRILPLLRDITETGVNVHLYPTSSNPRVRDEVFQSCTENPRMHWHDPLPYKRLLTELTQYDCGLILLSPANERLLNVAMPNKMFEYLVAGLPVGVSPYRSLIDFVEKNRCGGVLRSAEDVREIASDRPDVEFKDEYTIDFHIGRLTDLYGELAS
ncbi:MAG: glycosyltransferase [Thermoplasmata archaeon]